MNTLRVYVVGVFATLYQAGRVVLAAWRRSPHMACVCRSAPRRWASAILRAARVQVELEGFEHLPEGTPAVLVANHESWFDVFALAAHLPVEYRFVAKKELASIPVFGSAWRACRHVSIDRSDRTAAIRSLEVARESVHADGVVMVMFPEGTRSTTSEMLPFKKGAFVLALQLGVPVIPVGISGSRPIMPKGAIRVRPGTVKVRVGEPIPVEGMGERDRNRLLAQVRSAVEELRGPSLDAKDGD